MRLGKIVSFYLVRAVVPYFVLAWLILSVILFVQQAGRYSDIFFDPNLPSTFVWQLTVALIPNVIAFTCPMAVLVGVIIGLSRMQSDSELIAIRNIGVGNFAAVIPVLILGLFLSLFSIAVNIFGVPAASRAVRMVAVRTALYKLESPIEPGVFNTEIAGFTIYVRGADFNNGTWKNVFVYNEDAAAGKSRLITSRRGRIDSNGERSELVLEDAVVTTLNTFDASANLVSESIGELRLAIRTRRDEMAAKVGGAAVAVEELGLTELARFGAGQTGREVTEAKIIIVRRIVLSLAPILFSLLGSFMVLSFTRRGRGFGVLMALAALLLYFLLTFAGEQLARSGSLSVIVGGLIAPAATLAAIAIFAFNARHNLGGRTLPDLRNAFGKLSDLSKLGFGKDLLVDLTAGIRDLELAASVLRFYVFSVVFMAAVFMIFTVFELWRFAGAFSGGMTALLKYLVFLSPFTYLQLAPTATMIAILTVYTIKSRQNEVVVWYSAGQSIYRLILPILLLMLILGGSNFILQETLAPITNRKQEVYRRLIRNRGNLPGSDGRFWVATDRTIASFRSIAAASDNEYSQTIDCFRDCALRDIMIYLFQADKAELQAVYHISEGVWESGRLRITGAAYKHEPAPAGFARSEMTERTLELPRSVFTGTSLRTNQMSVFEIAERIPDADSDVERRALSSAVNKRYSNLFLPFIIALFTAPFAIGLQRKGRVVSISYGVGLWLVFIVSMAVFEQLGLVGTLPPAVAVWAPLLAFMMFGIYLISRVRT